MKIRCKDTGEVVRNYADYLKTEHWKKVREVARLRSGGKCRCCGKDLEFDFVAHHRTYRRIGKERMGSKHWFLRDDVVAVCTKCHDGKRHDDLHEFVRVPKWARKEK